MGSENLRAMGGAPDDVLSAHSELPANSTRAPAAPTTDNLVKVGMKSSLAITTDSLLISVDEIDSPGTGGFYAFWTPKTIKTWNIPFYNVLWAEFLQGELIIRYARPLSDDVKPAILKYPIDPRTQKVKEWISKLLDNSYRDSPRRKRAKVLVNPHSGRGQAQRLFSEDIEPLLIAAGCTIDMVETQYAGHGTSIMEQLDVDAFDMVVVCSGDGLAHEVFNGLGKRSDARKSLLMMAVAHIPCGSGNGLSHNLNDTGNVSKATLAVIKGLRKRLDLISITQGDIRTLSFLSQAVGMGAESDLATEHLRWMGDVRFKLGFFTRIMARKIYPAQLALKITVEGKNRIQEHYKRETMKQALGGILKNSHEPPRSTEISQGQDGLPPLKYGTINDKTPEDWVVIPCDTLGNLYCGNLAYMGANAKFFPAALHDDGTMDLVYIDGSISRCSALQVYAAVQQEKFFDMTLVQYWKVLAYRWTPRNQDSGYVSIDGESHPFEPFQAEIHKGLGTIIIKNRLIPGALL